CLAAERLADALGVTSGNLTLSEDAGEAAGAQELRIPVKDIAAVPAAVAVAVWHVRSTAVEYARPRANVDAWLAGFAGLDEDEDGNVEPFNRCAIPVMLLANGRTDEALEQVARYER